jgi:hypothetical protein
VDFFLHFSEESFLFILFFCCLFAGIPAVMFPDDLAARCHAAAAFLLPAQVTGHHMIFPDRVIACRAGHQAMGADILLAILAALADMILTIGLFTDTAGYGMILTYPFVTITAPGTMVNAERVAAFFTRSDIFL